MLAVSLRPGGVQVAVSSAHPRRLADAQLLRLSGYERHRHIMAAIRTEGFQLGFPGDVRRTRHHAVAHLHGCERPAAPVLRRTAKEAHSPALGPWPAFLTLGRHHRETGPK